jgi:hypothetical protein
MSRTVVDAFTNASAVEKAHSNSVRRKCIVVPLMRAVRSFMDCSLPLHTRTINTECVYPFLDVRATTTKRPCYVTRITVVFFFRRKERKRNQASPANGELPVLQPLCFLTNTTYARRTNETKPMADELIRRQSVLRSSRRGSQPRRLPFTIGMSLQLVRLNRSSHSSKAYQKIKMAIERPRLLWSQQFLFACK